MHIYISKTKPGETNSMEKYEVNKFNLQHSPFTFKYGLKNNLGVSKNF